MKFTPKQVREALSVERLGGTAFMNFCADGETLLTKDIDLYIKEIVGEGHYVEVVTNMTITPMLDRILSFEPSLLKRIEFKCSFHYLQLKEKNLLSTFAANVNKVWEAGASANIELAPSDELIPYIEEVKEFSIENFGALPHLTITRDDTTEPIDYLTNMSVEEYDNTWSQFDSGFWQFKKSIFKVKQSSYCYAGLWSAYINLATGDSTQCYCGASLGNVFQKPYEKFNFLPIGKCKVSHCYNGHALLTLGLIPNVTDVRYGNIRDRIRTDGTHWLQPELLSFFNSQCGESNREISEHDKKVYKQRVIIHKFESIYPRAKRKINNIFYK